MNELMGLPNATVDIRPEWSSRTGDYRRNLRKALFESCKSWIEDCEAVLDLDRVPQLPGIAISISHCPSAGGYIAVRSRDLSIGLDIEEIERITPAIENRVSFPGETSSAPLTGAVWVAKEATFKALAGPKQPKLVSEIETYSWIAESSTIWRFSARSQADSSMESKGIVWVDGRLILGLSEKKPQLWSRDSR